MNLACPTSVRRIAAIGGCGVALLLSACAAAPRLAPGMPSGQVVQALGPPTRVYELSQPAGVSPYLQIDTSGAAKRRFEYNGGTYGTSTYMLDFDASDRLLASAQVRAEPRFNAIRAGMDQSEVLRAIGHPSTIWHLGFQRQNVWAYRFETPFCQWFQVGMGYDGKVVDTAYGPDPKCDLFDDNR